MTILSSQILLQRVLFVWMGVMATWTLAEASQDMLAPNGVVR